MPGRFLLSHIKALPFDFDAKVAEFIAAKKAHALTVGEAAPSAPHHWIEQAVRRVSVDGAADDFVADYELIDDTPPPPTLEQKKHQLVISVAQASAEAVNALIPRLKGRLWSMEHHRISVLINAAAVPLPLPVEKPGIVAMAASAVGLTKKAAPKLETGEEARARAIETVRASSPSDIEFFLAHGKRLEKVAAIHLHAATLESEIHDLTDETVDTWRPAPFPT